MFLILKKLIEKVKFILSGPSNPKHTYSNSYYHEKGEKKLKVLMDKGEYLEKSIFDILNEIIGYGPKKILVDLHINKSKNGSNQIDLVVLHKTGVYVIEAKNFSGYVCGNNDYLNWVQKFGKNKTYKFYNPIKQNNSHVLQIKRVLGLKDSYEFVSLIVFGDKCKIDYKGNINLLEFNTSIINIGELRKCIKNCFASRDVIFSEDEIFDMYDKLSNYARQSSQVKSEHIKYVKKMQNSNK